MQTIEIPYAPRKQLMPFHNRKERFACIVAHRRFGKTVGAINDLIKSALSIDRPNVRCGYIAPYFNQAKAISWDYIKQFTAPIPGMSYNESELRADFPNGARLRLFGADNYDAMRGLYFDDVVLDEPADFPANAWPTVIRPALADRQGRATFIGTPKGKNEFWEIYDKATRDPNWFTLVLPASQTGIIAQIELNDALKTIGPDRYDQEFECSFEAAIIGAYYGKEMKELAAAGRIRNIIPEPQIGVVTAWDLGMDDTTSILFAQYVGNEIRIIDHIEDSGQGLAHYARLLADKPYTYLAHVLPHDARVRELGSGVSRIETLEGLGLRNITIAPNIPIEDGIQAVRNGLARTFIDTKLNRVVEALKQYQREWDERSKTWRSRPKHDWTSHTCLVAGSMVLTERGEVPIENICAGDKVVTPDGLAHVSGAGIVKVADELIEVTLKDGSRLTMTPEHKVFTTTGLVKADSLRYGDQVITKEELQCWKLANASKMGYRAAFIESFGATDIGGGPSAASTSAKKAANSGFCIEKPLAKLAKSFRSTAIGMTSVLKIGLQGRATRAGISSQSIRGRNLMGKNTISAQMDTFAAVTQRPNSCTVLYGQPRMATSLMASMSITSTATKATTALKTCRQSLHQITRGITALKASGSVANKISSNFGTLATKRKLGMRAPKDWLGIPRTARRLGKIGNLWEQFAQFAVKNIKHSTQAGHGSAAEIVRLRRFAGGVPVYDMTVDHHHCYVANGMLVSNCDSARYLFVGYRAVEDDWGAPLRRGLKGVL